MTDTVPLKHAQVLQTRPPRDGRQIVEIDCAVCDSTHWLLSPGGLVECLSSAGRFMYVDGLGCPAGSRELAPEVINPDRSGGGAP
jgi:hypothetical protein